MMCRNQLSIGWDGKLYDCDFNQTLGWTTDGKDHISMLKGNYIEKRQISLGNHCYACTAGNGSSVVDLQHSKTKIQNFIINSVFCFYICFSYTPIP